MSAPNEISDYERGVADGRKLERAKVVTLLRASAREVRSETGTAASGTSHMLLALSAMISEMADTLEDWK